MKCRGGEGGREGLFLSWSLGKMKLSVAAQCGGRWFKDTLVSEAQAAVGRTQEGNGGTS